jgi:gas vesicle protein
MGDYSLLIHLCTTIGAIAGAVVAIQKSIRSARIERDAHSEEKNKQSKKILKDAQEALELVKSQLDAKVQAVDVKVDSLSHSTEKELAHLKELHNNEIKNLGEKIEQLRRQLNDQHTQLLSFLTRLVEKK